MSNQPSEVALKDAVTWWEKRRIWFNVAVGVSGIAAIVIFDEQISEALIIGLVLVSLGAWIAHSRLFKRKNMLNESLKIN